MSTHTDLISVPAPGPAVWLYGAHGGAGVSTLTHYLSFAGDCERQWPCGSDVELESPYVVIVARETSDGLKAAHQLIVDHNENGRGGDLLGLITIASSPTLDKSVRQYRDVVTSPNSISAHWSIGWHKFLAAASRPALPQWHPFDGIPEQTKGAAVPTDVIAAGVGIVTAIQKSLPTLRHR